jgi:probable F420-dependent oxidoreductase
VHLGATFTNTTVGTDFPVIRTIVQALETTGFRSIATNDHVVGSHPDRSDGVTMNTVHTAVHEPIVLLSMIGAVTSRVELVTAIVIAPQRQTVLLAKQAAQLDLLTGGRLRLGIGVGRNWIEYEALNEDFRTRGRRIEEQVAVMRRLWADELVTFEGEWHHLDRVGINPRPARPTIPIWMGSYFGGVSERVLQRVGRIADGWMPQFPPGELAPVLDRVRGYAAEAGRDPAGLGIECIIKATADDHPDQWVELAGQYRELGATHLRVLPALLPDATPHDQLDVMLRWYDAVAPSLADDPEEPTSSDRA